MIQRLFYFWEESIEQLISTSPHHFNTFCFILGKSQIHMISRKFRCKNKKAPGSISGAFLCYS